MFVDETEIRVSSGRGGDGMLSFRREKYVPRGGPDGGDGGRGGDVVLRSSAQVRTLVSIQHGRHYRAENGRAGGPGLARGRSGAPLVVEVPVGTLVRDARRGHVLRDLDRDGLSIVVVAGGVGGKGNKHFANATNRAPRQTTPGREGESRSLRLELRLVADVGLVGLPNAGKSTFLRTVSAARPKVADYPFTTLEPVLGLVSAGDRDMVVADIPGLIEGAHGGAGLGDRFLRHVARTRVLLQLVSAEEEMAQTLAAWRTVGDELRLADLGLDDKPVVLALSRADTVAQPDRLAAALAEASGQPVSVLSALTGQGVAQVLERLEQALSGLGPAASGKTGE